MNKTRITVFKKEKEEVVYTSVYLFLVLLCVVTTQFPPLSHHSSSNSYLIYTHIFNPGIHPVSNKYIKPTHLESPGSLSSVFSSQVANDHDIKKSDHLKMYLL